MSSNLQFIRGIVINDSTLRVLIGRRFPDIWTQYMDCQEESGTKWNWFLYETNNPLEIISKKLGLSFYCYPCFSKLRDKAFVIGKKYIEVEEATDKVVYEPAIPDYLDEEISQKLMKFSDVLDPTDIKSVIIIKCAGCKN